MEQTITTTKGTLWVKAPELKEPIVLVNFEVIEGKLVKVR